MFTSFYWWQNFGSLYLKQLWRDRYIKSRHLLIIVALSQIKLYTFRISPPDSAIKAFLPSSVTSTFSAVATCSSLGIIWFSCRGPNRNRVHLKKDNYIYNILFRVSWMTHVYLWPVNNRQGRFGHGTLRQLVPLQISLLE